MDVVALEAVGRGGPLTFRQDEREVYPSSTCEQRFRPADSVRPDPRVHGPVAR
jgi:hypothetical protein